MASYLRLIFLLGLIVLGLGGCNSITAEVRVDGVVAGDVSQPRGKYHLVPSGALSTVESLEFREYARIVKKVLARNQFIEAQEGETPALTIVVDFRMGEPIRTDSTITMPVYGQTGGGYSSYTGTVTGSGGTYYGSGTIYQPPTYGVVNNVNVPVREVTYVRNLTLMAYQGDLPTPAVPPILLWKTMAVSAGSSGDKRFIFPYLLTAMEKYIATNTGKSISVQISENDKRMAEIVSPDN